LFLVVLVQNDSIYMFSQIVTIYSYPVDNEQSSTIPLLHSRIGTRIVYLTFFLQNYVVYFSLYQYISCLVYLRKKRFNDQVKFHVHTVILHVFYNFMVKYN